MTKKINARKVQRVLLQEKPEIGHTFFLIISAVMLIDDLPILLISLVLNLPWVVTSIVFAVNVLVFGSIFMFIHFRGVSLTDRRVIVRFGAFRSSVPLKSVRSVAKQNPPRWQIMSGLVSAFRGRLVYCFKSTSPFIMLKRTSGVSKSLYFNVSNAHVFIRKLNEAKREELSV
jgi:hypothetical protein